MLELLDTEKIIFDGVLYSFLGKKGLSGNVESIKFLFSNSWKENPPLIETINQMQEHLTSLEIECDGNGLYCDEFLYYWAMLCIGETSSLIVKDLGTAKTCLKKIVNRVSKANARLAYIKLLQSDEPSKSDKNVEQIDILRQWAGKGDLFSRIVLAKLVYYQFLNENPINGNLSENFEIPIKAIQLLKTPYQKGHPVAVKFYNQMMSQYESPDFVNIRTDETKINSNVLCDF